METQKVHYRHCMLFMFKQGKNATEAASEICSVYGENAVTPRVCQKWFARFRDGNFQLEDQERAGRPRELNCEDLEAVVDENPRQSTRKLADILNFDQSTILRRLNEIGKKCKLGKRVPYTLSETSKMQRLNICISLWAKIQKKNFLWKIVTGDEKWIFFDNPHNQKQWLSPGQASIHTPMQNIHGSKVTLCVWWDMKSLLY
jgi:histone-lysine N-methyltransferase SETMAR